MARTVKDKVCVVTGGASGIGEAICRKFAQDGAQAVVVVDLSLDRAASVARTLKSPSGGQVGHALSADCSSEMDLRRIVMQIEHRCGPIDVCVSNAGIPANGGIDVPNDEWAKIWQVNVMQHVYLARYLVPLFRERGEGRLVITASAAGLLTQVGSLPYSVTKAAAVSVAEWLAITHHGDGVKVNLICPQAVNTPFIGDAFGADASAKKSAGGVAGVDGVIQPSDVAQVLVDAMEEGRFLVLPHPSVHKYMMNKARDYDRWLGGMRKLHNLFGEPTMRMPPFGFPAPKL